jgi:hypothetical protein
VDVGDPDAIPSLNGSDLKFGDSTTLANDGRVTNSNDPQIARMAALRDKVSSLWIVIANTLSRYQKRNARLGPGVWLHL